MLREKFGFNGVIITDATIMGGYCMSMKRRDALPATLMAGCDMFCFTTDIYEDLAILKEALRTGKLTRSRLDEAVIRVLALKRKLEDLPDELPEIEAEKWKAECVDRAITRVKDTQKLIPVSAEKYPKVKLVCIGEDAFPEGGSMAGLATKYLTENGFSVVYQPSGRLFGLLEEEHFGRRSGNTLETVLSCDLLVIDDLGTEFETSFVAATLYTIINTRMLDGLPTVISTNLTQEGLQSRYGDQTVSRITGAFEPLLFVGKDIRQQKRTAAMRS